MSDVIRLLPDSVANQIAAGEVIQRPASVIKELIENAVDAKATDISVVIKDAGKTLIQVIDNGVGMSDTDVRMAFERHATSKIQKADDLFSLHTMGFRGEALPSICAIAEVEVKTKMEGMAIGTRLVIQGSKVVAQEPCVCEKGTVISVRKIFYNVPARRKFLKSDNVELSNIMREFERLALVNNAINMHLDTGTRQLDLRAASLRLRIEDIWKNNLKSDHLIPVDVDTSLVKIEGFISRPEFARRRNPLQYLIVNGRNMRHPYFHKAIVSCYDGIIAPDTMPCYFFKFIVDPASIDVNIHPTKNEIKFEYEQEIWPIIASAVKTALGKYSAVPSIDFSVESLPVDPIRKLHAPELQLNSDYNPFASSEQKPGRVDRDWQKLYAGFENYMNPAGSSKQADSLFNRPQEPGREQHNVDNQPNEFDSPGQICIQCGAKYIITTSRNGLLIIDQHRAHVKILFEEYMARAAKQERVSQRVLFPETVSLSTSQQTALNEIQDELSRLGFSLEYECDTSWRISAVPPLPPHTDARDVILRMLDSVAIDSVNYGNDGNDEEVTRSLQEKVSLLMARSAAIRRGQRLTGAEMENIVASLFALPDPSLTPNGNMIFTLLDESRISKLLP